MDIDAHFEEDQIHLNEGAFIARKIRREKSRKKLYTNLKKISSMANKIFVFHYPPLGFFDIIHDVKGNVMNGKSAGINFFREAISEQKPSLALCGHMHEYQGMKKMGKTSIINPGAARDGKCAIIDFDEKKGKVKKVEFIK